MFFTQLMPIIGRRPVSIVVAPESNARDCKLIRVTVILHSLKTDKEVDAIPYSGKDEIAPIPSEAIDALTRGLCLTGTPDEMNTEFIQKLTNFTASHVELQKAVDQAKEEIAAAVRAVKERDERKKKEKDEKSKAKSKNPAPATASVAISDEEDEETKEDTSQPKAKEPEPANLALFT